MTTITIDVDRLRADIVEKRRELQALEAMEQSAARYAVTPTPQTDAAPSNGHMDSKDFAGLTLFDAAELVLKKAGRPMKTAEITASLAGAGLGRGEAKVFSNSIYAAMRRKRETFELVEPGTWGLVAK